MASVSYLPEELTAEGTVCWLSEKLSNEFMTIYFMYFLLFYRTTPGANANIK